MKKTLLLLLATAGTSLGQIIAGFGYAGTEFDSQGLLNDDISLGVLYGSLGYEINTQNEGFRFVPELRVGSGIEDDTILGVDLEVEYFVSLSLRAEVHQNDATDFFLAAGAYAFVNPTFSVISVEASTGGVVASETAEEFGVGVGLGYNFTEIASAEIYAEFYDDVTVCGVGGRFRF